MLSLKDDGSLSQRVTTVHSVISPFGKCFKPDL